MRKIIKSRIFLVILTAILCTSIGVYAATQYAASQITYNKNGQVTVEAALNDLYNNKKDDDKVVIWVNTTLWGNGSYDKVDLNSLSNKIDNNNTNYFSYW